MYRILRIDFCCDNTECQDSDKSRAWKFVDGDDAGYDAGDDGALMMLMMNALHSRPWGNMFAHQTLAVSRSPFEGPN